MGWNILRRFRKQSVEQDARGPVSFSDVGRDEEATEREEYGLPDRGEAVVESSRYVGLASDEAAQAALDELGEFKQPRDPNP